MIALVQDMFVRTLTDPKAAALRLRGLNLPGEARWIGFAIAVILSVLLQQAVFIIAPLPSGSVWSAIVQDPVSTGLTQALFILAAAWAMAVVAGWFGGKARFADTLLAMAWIEFVLLLVEVAQIVILMALPVLSVPLFLISVFLFFWLLTHFTAALNGFAHLGKVFAGVFVTLALGLIVIIFVMSIFGLIAMPVTA